MWCQHLPSFLFVPDVEVTLGFSAVNPFLKKEKGRETACGENGVAMALNCVFESLEWKRL